MSAACLLASSGRSKSNVVLIDGCYLHVDTCLFPGGLPPTASEVKWNACVPHSDVAKRAVVLGFCDEAGHKGNHGDLALLIDR